jgi:hypothetical protein
VEIINYLQQATSDIHDQDKVWPICEVVQQHLTQHWTNHFTAKEIKALRHAILYDQQD